MTDDNYNPTGSINSIEPGTSMSAHCVQVSQHNVHSGRILVPTMTTPPPSFAPTGTTSYQPLADRAGVHQEITKAQLLGSDLAVYDSLAELYLILPTLEVVERAFIKDFITDKEKYTATCTRLLNQYRLIISSLIDDHLPALQRILGDDVSPETIVLLLSNKFNLCCPLAAKRVAVGYPATIQSISSKTSSSPEPAGNQRLIAQVTGNFITVMDAIKLNYNTKAQLHPLLSELVITLNDLPSLVEFSGKSKMVNWLIKLNNLEGSLSEEELDEFLGDIDAAYKGFFETL